MRELSTASAELVVYLMRLRTRFDGIHEKGEEFETYRHLLAAVGRERLLVLQQHAKVRLPGDERRLVAVLRHHFVARMVTQSHFLVCKRTRVAATFS